MYDGPTMTTQPWDDWIPGALNDKQTEQLCNAGHLMLPPGPKLEIDNSSIDLSISGEAWKLRKGSVKPCGDSQSYDWFIVHEGLAEEFHPDANGVFNLYARSTYIFKLRERLNRNLAQGRFFGQATPKSSVGRVDVLVRLIVNGMDSYEGFTPVGLERGDGGMYAEVTPITFNVSVKEGSSLSQLRLFYGSPEEAEIRGPQLYRTIFQEEKHDGSLTVDLRNESVGGCDVAAFCGYSSPGFVSLMEGSTADPCRYWKFVTSDSGRLTIENEKFYILRSRERIAVPPGVAIYCKASDETIGEMRIHYAGFVHPRFGRSRDDKKIGTPLIFEVRGHQVDVTLADGERMANLKFYRMSEDCTKPGNSKYENQVLQLSKFFSKWPEKLKKVDDNGTVEPA